MRKGKVKFFNTAKGFGFVIDKDSKEEIFVHVTEVEGGKLSEGDDVTFQVGEGKRGPVAVKVKLA